MNRGILIIAPDSNLNNVADIVASAQGFRVTTLRGYVTGREILKEIATGHHKVIHFACHGCTDKIQASDGPVSEEYLETALRGANVDLVLFNSCASITMAARIYRAGTAQRVIGWRSNDLTDKAAVNWAMAFYQSLALGADYGIAYHNANEILGKDDNDFEEPILLNGRITLLEQQMVTIQNRLSDMDRLFAQQADGHRKRVLLLAALFVVVVVLQFLILPQFDVMLH